LPTIPPGDLEIIFTDCPALIPQGTRPVRFNVVFQREPDIVHDGKSGAASGPFNDINQKRAFP
jgi:hypothetical protein